MSNDKDHDLIGKVLNVINRGIQVRLDTGMPVMFSKLIIDELDTDYDTLNDLFHSRNGSSLNDFIASAMLEKVKELMVYTEQSLAEITRTLGYRNPSYLSRQLKRHTGFTASHLKQIRRDKLAIMEKYYNDSGKREG